MNIEIENKINELVNLVIEQNKDTCAVKPPDTTKIKSYQNKINQFTKIRSDNLIFPYLGSGRGNGCFVELDDGSVKLDLINGIGVHHFGKCNPKVLKAQIQGACSDIPIQGNLQQNRESLNLSKKILDLANKNKNIFSHVFLTSSGVMAGENALKITLQKKFPANRILAFENNFAGRTITFSQINDKPAFRENLPNTLNVDYVPFFDYKNSKTSIKNSLKILRKYLRRYPNQHSAMIFELVQGEGGFWHAPREFYVELMTELKKHNIAVLIDEIQTFARLPEPFAFQHFELEKYVDVAWIGKASLVCATIFSKEFKPKPFLLAQTYTSASSIIFTASTIFDELQAGNYFGKQGKINKIHNYFKAKITRLQQKFPEIITLPEKYENGIGAMLAFTPFGGEPDKVKKFVSKLFENGLITATTGSSPMRVRFLVPIGSATEKELDLAFEIIEKTINDLI